MSNLRDLKGKRVVVTGGAGFLGSHVVRLLLAGRSSVIVLDDFSNGKMENLAGVEHQPRLEILRGDVTEPSDVERALAGADVVVHLAVLCLRQSIKDPRRVTEVIVGGTLNCLEAARANGVELFLNCSSSETYGSAVYLPMDEDHPLNPETPYAAAKVAQDMYVRSYGATYRLPWTTIRPFNMFGPNSHWQGHRGELIPKLIVRAMNRRPLVVFGDGRQTRDFLFVEDAARALVAAARCPDAVGEHINLCSGVETSIRRIAELVCASFDLDPEQAIRREAGRPGDVTRHLGDGAKLRRLLGFKPQTDLVQGIRKTVAWFRTLPCAAGELLTQERLRNWE